MSRVDGLGDESFGVEKRRSRPTSNGAKYGHHFYFGERLGVDVAEPVVGLDEVVAGIHVAVVFHRQGRAAGRQGEAGIRDAVREAGSQQDRRGLEIRGALPG